jgi:hypothetical protein
LRRKIALEMAMRSQIEPVPRGGGEDPHHEEGRPADVQRDEDGGKHAGLAGEEARPRELGKEPARGLAGRDEPHQKRGAPGARDEGREQNVDAHERRGHEKADIIRPLPGIRGRLYPAALPRWRLRNSEGGLRVSFTAA